MTDWELFGAEAAGHQLTSLRIHVVNTELLFLLLDALTGATGRAIVSGLLRGGHPAPTRLRPAHSNLAAAFILLGRYDDARTEVREAPAAGFEPPPR